MNQRDEGRGDHEIERISSDTGFSRDAVEAMATAMRAGGGTMAQFNHPELGGFGQWSSGGMLMIGEMFNDRLKARVSELAEGVSYAMSLGRLVKSDHPDIGGGGGRQWWPDNFGSPNSTGSQNGVRYAVFSQVARLAIEENGQVRLYDTADHRIGGVSQQQGAGAALTFTSQSGPVDLNELRRVDDAASSGQGASNDREPVPSQSQQNADRRQQQPTQRAASPMPIAERAEQQGSAGGDPIDMIRRLAELHASGHLTDEEYKTKKSELLARL